MHSYADGLFYLQRLINAELITKTMAYQIIFSSTERSSSDSTLMVQVTSFNELFIEINTEGFPPSYVCLDKETSIRLAKELRKQISFLED
jgi:hypothetical protein